MISSLSGTVRYKDMHSLIVDVGGVGYKVHTPTDLTLDADIGNSIFLWTHQVVRENSLDLFGFSDKEHLDVFELLITISGIGPRTALGILNVATPVMLRQAVSSGDTSYLTRVSGIGKKNAEKIVIELRDKLALKENESVGDLRAESDALEALVSLGYTEKDARDALKEISQEIEGASERVKHALKVLASKG